MLSFEFNLDQRQYCPWCYNKKQDYDEDGIDCGKSCQPCTIKEEIILTQPQQKYDTTLLILGILFILSTVGGIISYKLLFTETLLPKETYKELKLLYSNYDYLALQEQLKSELKKIVTTEHNAFIKTEINYYLYKQDYKKALQLYKELLKMSTVSPK